MVSEQLETRISAPRGVFRALVLERRSGACALMIRALEAAGAVVEVVRTGDEVGSAWVGQEVFVVEAGARDESLRQLVKWARQAGGEPYVVAVGDGMHDPGWLTAGRHGAQASMLEPDAGAAAMIVAEAREWLEVKKVAVEPMAAVTDTKTAPVAGKLASVPVPAWLPVLLDRTTVAMAVFDAAMRYRLANRSWRELFGLLDRDISGRAHFEVVPAAGEGWREVFHRALGGETLVRDEDTMTSPGGNAVPIRWEIGPWRGEDGKVAGVVAVLEPRVARSSGGAAHFEAGLGRSILGSSTGWLVVQDPQGIVLGSSKGFSAAAGRAGRMFGRSYWEAVRVVESDFPEEDYLDAMAAWRDGSECRLPSMVNEVLVGPAGRYEVAWSLFPYYPDPGSPHGVVRVGVPRLAGEADDAASTAPAVASPFEIAESKSQGWDLPWDEDVPVLLWEADEAGMITRVGEGLRRWAGISGRDTKHADEFGRRVSLTPTWFQKVNACHAGGLPVDERMDVKTDDGVRALRFIGTCVGGKFLRGWAVPADEPPGRAASAVEAKLVAAESEKKMLRERLEHLVRALGEARRLEPAGQGGALEHIEDFLPLAVFVVDGSGVVVSANKPHSALTGVTARPGTAFETWLAHAAGGDTGNGDAAVEKWRAMGWRKQVPCVLPLVGAGGVEKLVEFQARLAGDGMMVVAARDVTDEQRMLESFKAGEARKRVENRPATAADGTLNAAAALRPLAALRHRVNNDLQVLAALCSMGDGMPVAPGPRTASLQRRLQVASLAYGATAVAAGVDDVMDASSFLASVVAMVERETGLPARTVKLQLEHVMVPASRFLLLGLAVREMLDNALRHGLGPVEISSGVLGGTVWLEVVDHGPGLPAGFAVGSSAGLGLRVVEMACDELGGRLSWQSALGTCFRLVFPAGKEDGAGPDE